MTLAKWQAKFYLGAAAILPLAPFLLMQGQITRWKVGVLPDADEPAGASGEGDEAARLLVIGESTVAGLGARRHEFALAGRFAEGISRRTERRVEWTAIGRNGVTARRTINELWPLVAKDEPYDYILLGIGGNDVMRLSSPRQWRTSMLELIGLVRSSFPEAVIFISNCPMIKYSPALPQPIRGILWQLSKLHDENIRDLTRDMPDVHYFPQPVQVALDSFWSDGIHPSEQGYADWATAMLEYFDDHHEW